MTGVKSVLLSFPVVAVALGALAVGLVELGRYLRFGLDSLFLLALPVALAVVYVTWYRTLPLEPRGRPSRGPSSPAMGSGSDEPFEDPVEEADRLDQETAHPPAEAEAPTIVDDDRGDGSASPP